MQPGSLDWLRQGWPGKQIFPGAGQEHTLLRSERFVLLIRPLLAAGKPEVLGPTAPMPAALQRRRPQVPHMPPRMDHLRWMFQWTWPVRYPWPSLANAGSCGFTVGRLLEHHEDGPLRRGQDGRARFLVPDGPTEQLGVEARQGAWIRRLDRGAPPHFLRPRLHVVPF